MEQQETRQYCVLWANKSAKPGTEHLMPMKCKIKQSHYPDDVYNGDKKYLWRGWIRTVRAFRGLN